MEQLGGDDGTRFVMASVAGRPYVVGFTFRVIAAQSSDSDLTQDVLTVMEYHFDRETFAYSDKQELLPTRPYELTKGSFLEFTAGRDRDAFTVVFVSCSKRCEVYGPIIGILSCIRMSCNYIIYGETAVK